MRETDFRLKDQEGVELFVRRWEPGSGKPKAVVQLEHGVAEHSGRYAATAEALCAAGYAVYADDHRGHGYSAEATGGLGRLGPGGWEAVVRDLGLLSDRVAEEMPGLPLFLVGHSWGSYLAQDYAQRWGHRLAGLVLVGTSGGQPFLVKGVGPWVGRLFVLFLGRDRPSRIADAFAFKPYNRPYLPSPTDSDSDWISRDIEEVRSFVDDPACAFPLTTGLSLEMSLAFRRLWRPGMEARIPKSLPILLMSGTDDASNGRLKYLLPFAERLRKRGHEDLTLKLYEGARHCILHETNRGEVKADLVAWLDARCGKSRAG